MPATEMIVMIAVTAAMVLSFIHLLRFAATAIIARSPAVSTLAAESPEIALTVLIGLFSFLVLLFSPRASCASAFGSPPPAFSKA